MTRNDGPGTTRRAFVNACLMATAAAVSQAVLPRHQTVARAAGRLADRSVGRAWLEARDVVRSGALGPVVWAQGYYPAGGAISEPARDRWARHLDPLLLATDLDESPSRVAAVGDAAPTLLVEFPSGALVYLAPAIRAAHVRAAVIQGRMARLSVRDDGLRFRLASDGRVEAARQAQAIVALAEASRQWGVMAGGLRG